VFDDETMKGRLNAAAVSGRPRSAGGIGRSGTIAGQSQLERGGKGLHEMDF
jgi:hypothetical protein